MKAPPPTPQLCKWKVHEQYMVAMAASTAVPFFFKMSLVGGKVKGEKNLR